MKLIKTIKTFISTEMDRYRKADESLLSEWFEVLYYLLQSEEKKGNVSYKSWYQKPGELELTEEVTTEPLYKVKILGLPDVVFRHRTYRPQISEVNLVAKIFPEVAPEIQSWRLDLVLLNEKGKIEWPETAFSRFQFREPQRYLKHEIRFSSGRELTAFEVKFVKAIFEKAIKPLKY